MKITCLFITCLVFGIPTATNAQLIITKNAIVKINKSLFIVLNNTDMVNNGEFVQNQGDGVLKFTGGSNNIVSGNPITVDRLVVSKQPGAIVGLQTNIAVSSNVTFNGGLLNLGNSVVNLGTGGTTSGESETSRAFTSGTGYLEASANLNQPYAANPGNLGGIISSSQNLGFTIIKRGNAPQYGPGLTSSVLRYYNISPTNNVALNASLLIQYFNAELNGIKASELSMFKDTGSNMWTDEGYSFKDTVNKFVLTSGIGSFSTFTLSKNLTALAVKFIYFTLYCNTGSVTAAWQTAQEINAKNYLVLKSVDGGIVWQPVASINAMGNGSASNKYSFIDNSLTGPQTEYRIAEYDFDGQINYSNTVLSNCAVKQLLSVFPNPVANAATIGITANQPGPLKLMLFDTKGALVLSQQFALVHGYNTTSINLAGFAKGTYILTANWQQNVQSVKVIKN